MESYRWICQVCRVANESHAVSCFTYGVRVNRASNKLLLLAKRDVCRLTPHSGFDYRQTRYRLDNP